MTTIFAGTSGFAYREWRGSFYPRDMAAGKMLSFYSGRLPAVEINSTYYRMPARRLLEQWGEEVAGGFRFALKAPAQITHRKKLAHAEQECRAFLETAMALGRHLGPLLFQLPPSLPRDLPLLHDFLGMIAGVRAAFEFRHPSWFEESTYRLLAESGCALCISDREELPEPPMVPTAPFGYLRLRRKEYAAADLKKWLDAIHEQGWEEAFVFFRHEETGEGTRLAGLLLKSDAS